MTEPTKASIKRHMRTIARDHVDPDTDEMNCTALAESTAHHFGRDEWLDDDTHIVWDLAIEIAEATQAKPPGPRGERR